MENVAAKATTCPFSTMGLSLIHISLSPHSRGGATASFMIYVPDADAAHAQAIQAGASENSPVKLEFWGDRIGTVVDPFGHKWSLATHVEDVSPEEMERRMQEWSSSQG